MLLNLKFFTFPAAHLPVSCKQQQQKTTKTYPCFIVLLNCHFFKKALLDFSPLSLSFPWNLQGNVKFVLHCSLNSLSSGHKQSEERDTFGFLKAPSQSFDYICIQPKTKKKRKNVILMILII